MSTNRAATWFGRVVWLGIVANLALAVPTLLVPARVMAAAGVPAATPLLWVRFSALLLMLLSLFYVPAAIDVYRYLPVAWLSVLARMAGVIFFMPQGTYRMLGWFDLAFFVPEAFLLVAAMARPHGIVAPPAPSGALS
jgi:hypothetical protein